MGLEVQILAAVCCVHSVRLLATKKKLLLPSILPSNDRRSFLDKDRTVFNHRSRRVLVLGKQIVPFLRIASHGPTSAYPIVALVKFIGDVDW